MEHLSHSNCKCSHVFFPLKLYLLVAGGEQHPISKEDLKKPWRSAISRADDPKGTAAGVHFGEGGVGGYKLQSPGIGTLSWPAAKALHAGKIFLSVSSDPATWLDPKPSPELKAFPLPSILIGKPVRFSWLFLFFHYSLFGWVNLFKSVLSHLVNKVTASKDKCYMWREGRPKSV